MHEFPPDLPRLRTLEQYLTLQLEAVRKAIREAQRTERFVAAKRWRIEPANPTGTPPRPALLHGGSCAGTPGDLPRIDRAQALIALADQYEGRPLVEPCPRCRPDIGPQA